MEAALTLRWSELRRDLLSVLELATIIVLVLLARADTVYAICLPFARSGWAIPLRAQHILWWGRLRGALCLALDTATTSSPRPIIQIVALHSAASAGKPSGS